jgi:hypothetical protein
VRPLPAMRPFFQSSLQGREDSSSALPSRSRFILGTCLVPRRSSSLFWYHTRSSLQSPASSFAILPDCTWFPEHVGLPHGVEKRVYHYIGGWNLRAYLAYIIGIIPNFHGFLNNMCASAPIGRHALLLLCLLGWVVCEWSSVLG